MSNKLYSKYCGVQEIISYLRRRSGLTKKKLGKWPSFLRVKNVFGGETECSPF
jgi:hypothetical protein